MSENPLLEVWLDVHGEGSEVSRNRPLRYHMDAFTTRQEMVQRYAFAVPSDAALDLIASRGPVVEIGAGTGYWAKLLRERGCHVLAYDAMGPAWEKWFPHGLVAEVRKGGVEEAAKHANRTLLLVWPYMDSMAYDAVQAYTCAGGQRVIYVGEGPGGCTADDDFFAFMAVAWQEDTTMALPQWDGMHDYLAVYRRL